MAVRASADDFGEVLARFRALSLYYQEVHWTLTGSWFYQDHLLAERLYNDVNGSIDEIAEKGIAAAGTSFVLLPAHLEQVQRLVSVTQHPRDAQGQAAFAVALQMEDDLGDALNGLYRNEEAGGDAAVSDLFQSLADGGLQRAYLLKRRIGA